MPKMKKSPEKANAEKVKIHIRSNIAYFQSMFGMDKENLAAVARMSLPTLNRRIRDPGKLTVDELLRLSAKFHQPITAFFSEKGQ